MRENKKRGKSFKYRSLKNSFQQKFEKEILKCRNKITDDVRNGDRTSTYSALRKLGARPGEKQLNTFDLPSHVKDNLTASQSAELIADHFGAISMDYDPININNFHLSMREAMSQPDVSVIPQLEEYQVYKKICKSKKPNSSVPGDIPK